MSDNEPTNREILEAVHAIAVANKETSEKVDGLSETVGGLTTKFDGLSEKVDGLSETVGELVFANREILEAVNDFSTAVEKRFNGIDQRFDSLESRVTNIESRVTNIETRTVRIESLMVTKDYLDDKLAILRGDVLHVIRKEDSRVTRLIEILYKKTVITNDEVKILEALQPLTVIA